MGRIIGKKVLMVGGAGRFGRFYTSWFRNKGFDVSITSKDHEDGKKVARFLKVNYDEEPKDHLEEYSAIVFTVPLKKAPKIIESYLPHISNSSLLVEMCSVKSHVFPVISKFKGEAVSLHPMHGPSISSLENVNVIAIPMNAGKKYGALKKMFLEDGAIWTETSVEGHDKILSYVQGFAHFFALSGAKFLVDKDLEAIRELSSTNFELIYHAVMRIASQNPELYSELQEINPYCKEVRKEFLEVVKGIVEDPSDAFMEVYNKVPDKRRVLSVSNVVVDKLMDELAVSIVTLGPEGSFSEKAARELMRYIRGKSKVSFKNNILSILEADANVSLVPIENTLGGSVVDALDGLLIHPKRISLEIVLPIHHSLVVHPEYENIETIISHPQAIAQCRGYIERNFPKAEIQMASSTSEAMRRILDGKLLNAAAIGRGDFAKKIGLKVIDENIEDVKNNVTRFWALGNFRLKEFEAKEYKTTLIFREAKDRPGLLRDILDVIANHGINLTRLESRPSRTEIGKYKFFMDLATKISEEELEDFRKKLEGDASIEMLGTYPVVRVEE